MKIFALFLTLSTLSFATSTAPPTETGIHYLVPSQTPTTASPPKKKCMSKHRKKEIEAKAAEAHNATIYLDHFEFERTVSKSKHLIWFSTTWCIKCKKFSPRWAKLQLKAQYLEDHGLFIRRVDCTDDERFCERYGVDGYPTILLFDHGRKVEEYELQLKTTDLLNYAIQKSGAFRDEL